MSDLEFYMLDAQMGSSKTEAALMHMFKKRPAVSIFGCANSAKGTSNFIYVPPTVRLLDSVCSRLEQMESISHVETPRVVTTHPQKSDYREGRHELKKS